MTENIPKFGVFRPLRPKSATSIGALAAFTAGQIEQYFQKEGIDSPVQARHDYGVALVPVAPLFGHLTNLPPGQFNYNLFLDKYHADVLPQQTSELGMSASGLVAAMSANRRRIVLSLGKKGAGGLIRRERQVLYTALRVAGAGSVPLLRQDSAPFINYIDFSSTEHGKMPVDIRQGVRDIATQILDAAPHIGVQFEPLVLGPNMRTPLPGSN
ncbi:MAG TPA: hypothetical protein VLF43_01485 [Candidatus Saccharimonadales bacterium]|nr:hypothetical protein [Candidatus Saccharimonadales bacterium]